MKTLIASNDNTIENKKFVLLSNHFNVSLILISSVIGFALRLKLILKFSTDFENKTKINVRTKDEAIVSQLRQFTENQNLKVISIEGKVFFKGKQRLGIELSFNYLIWSDDTFGSSRLIYFRKLMTKFIIQLTFICFSDNVIDYQN